MVSVAVGALGLVLIAGGAWYRDYASLRGQRAEFAALQARLAEQRLVFDAFQERVAQIRTEVDNWRGLHDRIWAPFGPEAGQERRGTAIGGRSAAPAGSPEDTASGQVRDGSARD